MEPPMENSSDTVNKEECRDGYVAFQIKEESNHKISTVQFARTDLERGAVLGVFVFISVGKVYTSFTFDEKGRMFPSLSDGCLPVLLRADRDGFFSRECSECHGFFKVKNTKEFSKMYCPYCKKYEKPHHFISMLQKRYIYRYVERFLVASEKGQDIVIDMDELKDNTYERERSRRKIRGHIEESIEENELNCTSCNCVYVMHANYGFCPYCGERSSFKIFEEKLNSIRRRNIKNSQIIPLTKVEYHELMKEGILIFEDFANDIKGQLLRIPATLERREDIQFISFRKPIEAAAALKTYFDIDMFDMIRGDDVEKLHSYFVKHLTGTRYEIVSDSYGGIEDQAIYEERSRNVRTFSTMLSYMAIALDYGYGSIYEEEEDDDEAFWP
jgi:hypothetical protein